MESTSKPSCEPPFRIRMANAVGRVLVGRRWLEARLDYDSLLQAARAQTRLAEFGPIHFVEPLRRLLNALESEAALSFTGRFFTHRHLLQLLKNRLETERDRAAHPEIAAQRVEAPVFILGLPRTGSTLLFELMALNPELRAPQSWEVMFPSPPPQAATYDSDPRIRNVERLFGWLDRLAPGFERIHPVGARRPQECIAIMAQSFRSIQFHTMYEVPGYQAWLEEADPKPAYAYHRRMLQQFQAFGPPGTWLLKAPGHLMRIEALFAAYPDARVVQTHRNPLEVIGSVASLCTHLRRAFSDRVDPKSAGRSWAPRWARALERTSAFRARHRELAGHFHDLRYRDFAGDPLAAVEAIHRQFGIPLGEEAKERMRGFLKTHPKHKHGVHDYSLSDYGLDAEVESARFRDYTEAFGLARNSEPGR